jgi:hypothetical protein
MTGKPAPSSRVERRILAQPIVTSTLQEATFSTEGGRVMRGWLAQWAGPRRRRAE